MNNSTPKTIIITGAFGVLGTAAAKVCLAQNANVALIDFAPVSASPLEANASTLLLGGVDLSDPAQANSAINSVVDRFGAIDGLLNIAGGFCWETFSDNDLDNWQKLFTLNVKTAITTTKAALPTMLAQGAGAIVCVSAAASAKGDMGMGPYAASKAGVSRFVESLAQETKHHGIRINAVAPSIIDTPQNRKDMPDADFTSWVAPAALAEVMLFLLSDTASVITGVTLPVTNRT